MNSPISTDPSSDRRTILAREPSLPDSRCPRRFRRLDGGMHRERRGHHGTADDPHEHRPGFVVNVELDHHEHDEADRERCRGR